MGQRATDPVIDALMRDALSIPGILSLAAGFTDNAVLPVAAVSGAVARLCEDPVEAGHLQYGTNQGLPALRSQVRELLAEYPGDSALINFPIEQICITNGSQQALYISAQLFCDPGDLVLVEAPSYFVFLECLRGMGVEARSLPTLPSGRLDPEGLEKMQQDLQHSGDFKRLKMIYLMGYHANPSARCLPIEDKKLLGRWLQELPRRIPVIEDGAYRGLYFAEPYPAPSLLSLDEFANLPVLYTGTFTKPFATGMKIGYALANEAAWIRNLLRLKAHQDFGTAHFSQRIISEVIRAGNYGPHLSKARAHYGAKMRLLEETMESEDLRSCGWRWQSPTGGLLLWLEGPDGLDTSAGSAFCQACLEEKVLYVPGNLCFAEGTPSNGIRLACGSLPPEQLVEAIRRFAKVTRRFQVP